MTQRHEMIVLGQALLTLGLLVTLLLTPGAPPSAAPAPQETLQTHVVRPRTVTVQATPASPEPKAAPAKVAVTEAPAVGEPAAPPSPSPVSPPSASEPAATVATVGGIPEIDANYRKARRQLLSKGFRPTRVAPPECQGREPSVDACWGALVEFPEIEVCSSGAKGSCVGWWLAPDGHVLRIQTSGDTGRIRDRHWASDGEIDELPRGWRP